nr:reverse transcriptase domain-containing protein [Tanacetum cinerariifolium]
MDLKNKLETTTKYHQASIQNLEAKFDRFVDNQSSRPSGYLSSNTQPNPKVIQVKQKQIFHIDSAMKHSYLNNDTCFSIDVIDEILEEDLDALLDKGSEILHSIEGTILEEKLSAEFDEFMAMIIDENSEFESDIEEPPFEKSPLTPIIRSKHLLKNLLWILNSNLFLIT